MSQAETQDASGAVRRHRALIGIVVSDKMDKTVVVQVNRRYKHARYKKYVNRRIKYKAHDERNEAHTGDRVRIVESRPLSGQKRWRMATIVEKATDV